MPDFMEENDEEFLAHVNQFLSRFGLRYEQVPVQDVHPVGWHTVEGLSPRGGQHAVVGRDGRMVWDPHPPDGTGKFLVRPEVYGLLLPTAQAKDEFKNKKIATGKAATNWHRTKQCANCGGPVPNSSKPGTWCQACLLELHYKNAGKEMTPERKAEVDRIRRAINKAAEAELGKAKDNMEIERVPNIGEKIKLPNGKATTVHKVSAAKDLFGRPEFHVLTTTGEVLPVTIKEK